MADRVKIKVQATPIEELTDENSGTHDVIASEVGTSLGGSGEGVDVADYSGSAANQGYTNATVNYLDCTHSAGGTALTGTDDPDFVFIKNTGHKFSSTTLLGASTTDCVMVVIREQVYSNGVTGGYATSAGTGQLHFWEVAWLKPGQAIVLPVGSPSLTQFGSNANDLSPLQMAGQSNSNPEIMVRTFQSNGSAATDGNAVEYLVVT